MKKSFIKYFILLVILPVFVTCQNPSDTVYIAPGTGLVSVSINKVNTARTILPDPKVADFKVIELSFTPSGGGNTETYNHINAGPDITIGLAAGTYSLDVTAYADTEKTLAAAHGSASEIVVNAGAITPAPVTLHVTFGEGDGTFSWVLTYPVDVTTATMTITPINETPGSAITIPLILAGSTSLASGEYRVEFSLRDTQGRTAELMEILHVYKNVTSTFTHEFTASNFHFLKVKQVIFPEGNNTTATVSLDGLTPANVVYLVKVNTTTAVVAAANTGNALLSSPPSLPPSASPPQNKPGIPELPRMGHPEADKSNNNPPPVFNQQDRPQGSLPQAAAVSVGATRDFWVEEYYNNRNWVKKRATLMAQGIHSNVWVMDGTMYNYASEVAVMFDTIYPAETNILGYEYGGGPGGDGGVDGDQRIQILYYPIVNASGQVAAGGYFWSKDFYPENYYSDVKSNEAEIFYMDSSQTREYSYSTLAHEFQHMIHFNRKSVDKGLTSTSWYNEMLSSMTEDVMANIIGTSLSDSSHIIHQRMIRFLGTSVSYPNYSAVGVTEWPDTGSASNNYSMVFAFGAYLMRNYGGVELLSKIMANNTIGVPSITAALNEIYEGMTFEQALARFGEAIVFNGVEQDSVVTFDKEINDTIAINSAIAYTYTAHAINVWADTWNGYSGYKPMIFNLDQRELRPSSISVHTNSTWTGITGGKTITLQKPANGVMFFLMVK